MSVDEAIEQLQDFIRAMETEEVVRGVRDKHGKISDNLCRDFEATKILLKEYLSLRKEVTNLARESIIREVELSKLQAEIELVCAFYRKKKPDGTDEVSKYEVYRDGIKIEEWEG